MSDPSGGHRAAHKSAAAAAGPYHTAAETTQKVRMGHRWSGPVGAQRACPPPPRPNHTNKGREDGGGRSTGGAPPPPPPPPSKSYGMAPAHPSKPRCRSAGRGLLGHWSACSTAPRGRCGWPGRPTPFDWGGGGVPPGGAAPSVGPRPPPPAHVRLLRGAGLPQGGARPAWPHTGKGMATDSGIRGQRQSSRGSRGQRTHLCCNKHMIRPPPPPVPPPNTWARPHAPRPRAVHGGTPFPCSRRLRLR